MSDSDFGDLTEFFNSLVGALENPQDDPELAELIEQALTEDAGFHASGPSPLPGRGSEQKSPPKTPSNLAEHLIAAVGKAEQLSRGTSDGGEGRTDESRGDKANGALAGASEGAPRSQFRGRAPLFANSGRHSHRAGQLVAAQLIQTIAKVA